MVIDSSALIAILFREPDQALFEEAIFQDQTRLVSAMTKLECGIVVVGGRGIRGGIEFDALLRNLNVEIVPFDDHQAEIARNAFVRFGKGRHRAGLNFGDCAAYALAVSEAEPLLFKGTDFAATDVEVVALGA